MGEGTYKDRNELKDLVLFYKALSQHSVEKLQIKLTVQ